MPQSRRLVATLVGSVADRPLTDALLSDAAQAIRAMGGEIDGIDALHAQVAVDVVFTASLPDAPERIARRDLAAALRERLAEPLDVFVQPVAYRRKKLLLADMDSTMIGQECIDELADFVGLREHVAAITERAMRGEIAFEPALRERVALLRGLEEQVIAEAISEKITLTPGGSALVATMRAHGAHTALVSGGFTAFTGRIADVIGFHEHRANTLIVEDGKLAGLVAEPILGREAKRAALIELRERHGLLREETLAIGDGANDLGMLGEAGFGVAYHAKPAVAAAADGCVDYGDLTALLYAQGYRREEFVMQTA